MGAENRSANWLVSPKFDLAMFGLPAAVGLLLVPLEPWLAPDGETPLPFWVLGILAIDVAHVWATIYRTYLNPAARIHHRSLLVFTPLLAFLLGATLAHYSYSLFWRVLAYLAVFHFVRQQYGWVALYHRKDTQLTRLDRWLDTGVIYVSTLYPLLWWHAHLPRVYNWFVPGDFIKNIVSEDTSDALWWPYLLILFLFGLRQVQRWLSDQSFRAGKILVVVSTAACWGVGIIGSHSDWAFTVTNVLIHGVPYFGLVWVSSTPLRLNRRGVVGLFFRRGWAFYGLLLVLAYAEEWAWDRAVWGAGGVFWGPKLELGPSGLAWATAVLAVPQVTHYVLDGFIWRRGTAATS